jgi:hypothetical protein
MIFLGVRMPCPYCKKPTPAEKYKDTPIPINLNPWTGEGTCLIWFCRQDPKNKEIYDAIARNNK